MAGLKRLVARAAEEFIGKATGYTGVGPRKQRLCIASDMESAMFFCGSSPLPFLDTILMLPGPLCSCGKNM
jgi:hypothetical protein